MAPSRGDFELAIAGYWGAKAAQLAAAELSRSTAEGSAKAVRGGGHFDPLIDVISRYFLDAGFPPESIGVKGSELVLPAYFRPNKAWDLVVVHRNILVAAIELKALGGPSFGNNYNNRVEEAIGSSADLKHANLGGLVGDETPWLGYFFLMDDQEESRRPCTRIRSGQFGFEPIWEELSYQDRFPITGRRMLDEGLYDAVCYVISSPDDPIPREPDPRLDWRHFSAAIQARIAYLVGLGIP